MNGAYNVPMDDAGQNLAMQQRMRLAESLRQKALAPSQPTMVGNQLVAPSPLQGIARLLSGVGAMAAENSVTGMANRYADAKRQRLAQTLAGLGDLSKPGAQQAAAIRLMQEPGMEGVAGQLLTGALSDNRMAAGFAHSDAAQKAAFEHADAAAALARTDADKERQLQREFMAQQNDENRKARADLAAQTAANANKPYFTYQPVTGPDGKVTGIARLDARGQNAPELVNIPGMSGPAISTKDSAAVRGAVSEAQGHGTAMGKAEAANQVAEPAAAADRQRLSDNIDSLLAQPNFDDIYGTVAGVTPDLMPASVNARAAANQVVNQLSLENRNKMKGQGQISDYEGKLLAAAATKLSNPRISAKEARQELAKLKGFLVNPPPRVGVTPGTPGAPTVDHSKLTDDELRAQLGITQ